MSDDLCAGANKLIPRYSVEETGPGISQLLRQIIADAGFELEFSVEDGGNSNPEFETPDIVVRFTGEDVDVLLSNKAELLLALELVTQEVLRLHSDDHSRISFDANDYRALRIEELRLSAATAAEKVKRSGTPFRFNPMNSRERRVIHIALRNEHELRSESSGSGPFRHVVIYPAGMPSLPDLPPPSPTYHHREHGRRPAEREHGRSGRKPDGRGRGGAGAPRGDNRPRGRHR